MADLGRLANAAAEATVSIISAASLAAEAHQNGLDSLPSWKTALLRKHLDTAVATVKHTVGICRSAVTFTLRAATHVKAEGRPADAEAAAAGRTASGAPAVALLPAQQHALRTIHEAAVTLSQVPREHPAAEESGPESVAGRWPSRSRSSAALPGAGSVCSREASRPRPSTSSWSWAWSGATPGPACS